MQENRRVMEALEVVENLKGLCPGFFYVTRLIESATGVEIITAVAFMALLVAGFEITA